MSYSRSSFRSTSSSYKYSEGISDDSYSRTSLTSSSRSSRLADDSLTSRTSRYSSSITGAGDDDITSIRRTGVRSSRFDDDDSGIMSSYRRTSRTSSRGDEDDLGLTSYRRRTSGFSDDDDSASYSLRRTKITSTYEIDDGGKTLKSRQTTVTQSTGDEALSSYLKYGAKAARQELLSEEVDAKPGDIFATVLDYDPPKSDVEGIPLKEGQEVECLETSNPRRWKVKTIAKSTSEEVLEGWVPSCYLEKKSDAAPTTPPIDPKMQETKTKREALVKELVETEEDFARDLLFVVNNYLKEMEGTNMPKELRDQKDVVFSNFKAISDVHNNVLVKGVQYYAAEPAKLGKTFLRLERDFDMHVNYCRDEPLAQEALASGPLKEYFDEFSKKISDDKTLSEHLKLPIQRINDYQLLLKEILKCTAKLKEDTDDLERALELMQAIPQRIADQKYLNFLHGYKGNISKLGRILKREQLEVIDENNVVKEKMVFLFKRHMFVADERRVGEDKSVYIVKNIFKIQDIDVQESVEGDSKKMVIKSKKGDKLLTFKANTSEQKEEWVKDIHQTSVSYVAEDLGEDEPVLMQEESVTEPEGKKPKLTKEGTETKSLDIDEKVISETDAKVEVLEDFEAYEEMNTAITESLRSGSLTSLEDFQSALEDEPSCVTAASEMEGIPGKPLFTKSLHGIVCKLGESPTFECQVATTTPTSVMWLKDNMPVTSSDHLVISSEDIRHCLTIKNAVSDDAGLYTVVVTNAHGTNSCSATLCTEAGSEAERPTSPGGTKLPYAPIFKEKLMNSQLIAGTNARFTITVDGVPEPTVTFYKDENELKQDNRIKVVSTISGVYELTMDNVSSSDAGKYSCIAINSEGRDVTAGNITVTKEKIILQVTQDSEAVSLSTGRDSKEPQYTWFKDGSEIEASERFKVAYSDEEDTLALVFQKVTPEDAGLYTCVACTSSGKISCSAELTVQGAELPRDHEAPVLIASLKDLEVSEGSSALLELKCSGYPKPKITWFKGGEEVHAGERIKFLYEDSESFTLVIKKVQKNDSGEYSAILKNDMGEVKCSCQLLVKSAPVFKKQMKDMAVMTDEPVKFEVEVEGAPTPELKWMKDGQELRQTDRIKMLHEAELHTLLIEKAKPEDSGNYSCVATNASGVQSGFAALSVNAPAAFSQKVKSIETIEEETISFSVKVSGNPKPKLKWLKDGVELKEDRRIKMEEEENTYTLIIEKVKSEDAGKYSCEIKNEYGSDSTTGDLTVSGKPSFTQKLSNIEVSEGEDANFTVKVTGKPEPKIKWYIGSMEITESQNYKFIDDKDSGKYTLQVKNVDSKLVGEYICEASNTIGKESTSGMLSVIETSEPPTFVEGLKDTSVKQGEDAEFTVKIKGRPKPTVKWTKDDAELTIDNKHVKVVDEASDSLTLLLKNVDSKDVGNYACEIKNEKGSEISSGKLCVKAPATFVKRLEDVEVEENVDVTFNVKIAGEPKPKVKWTKDGAELTIDGKHIKSIEEESAEFTLIIQQVTKDDCGIYSCEISNEHSKDISSCKLGVSGKPTFKRKLVDKQSAEGDENVEFVVEVDGSPAPTVKWYKGDSEISSNDVYKIEQDESVHKLIIKKATSEVEGTYTCKAKNSHGSADTSAAFTVQFKPKIIQGLKDIEVEEGKPVSLTIKVSALSSSDVKWKKNGEEVFEEATIKLKKELPDTCILVIEKTTISVSGTYECIITNKLGEASTSGKLTVKTKPKFEKGLKDMEVLSSEETIFEVIVKGNPSPVVTWSKDGKVITESENTKITKKEDTYTLTIKPTKVEDSGSYKCIAKNDVGEASESCLLSVQSTGDFQLPTFVQGLADQEILVGDAVRMEVKVIGKPTPDITWQKNEVELSSRGRIKLSSIVEDNYYSCTIKDITLEDEGEYVCKAINEKGESSSSCKLLIEEPTEPEIKGMKNLEASLGGAVKFEAEVTGVPAPVVYWLKDGKPLRTSKDVETTEDDTTNHFAVIIRHVKEENIGTYTCVAKNSAGEASGEGKLSLKSEAPAFLKEIGDKEATKGSTVIFEVRVSGYPLPEITWSKNNNPIITGDHYKVSSKDDVFKLEILHASVDEIGTYTCKAKNSAGEVHCKGALHLIEVAPTIQKGLHSMVTTKEGEPLKLEAKFEGEPKPDITWTKDGNEIKPSDHIKIETHPDGTTKLTVSNAKPEDAGSYAVVASNSKGHTDSQSKVSVEPKVKTMKPDFVQQLKMQECMQGEKVELTAKIAGVPLPVISWYKNGKKIEPTERISTQMDAEGNILLTISETILDDSGEYKSVATNDVGEASSAAKITVNAPAPAPAPPAEEKVQPPKEEKVPEETDKPAPPIAEAVPPATPTEVAKPPAPEVTVPSEEKPLPPGKTPEFLAILKPAQFIESETGELTAKISGEPLPKVKWLKNGKPLLPDNRYTYSENPDGTVSLKISDVKPEDAGKYALVITNDRGEEKCEAPVAVIPALKEKPRRKYRLLDGLQPLMLTEGKDGRLQARISGQEKPVVTWKQNGKLICSDEHLKTVEEADGVYALIINKATSTDAGKYSVTFTDASGEEESEALVTVVPAIPAAPLGKKPEFIQELKPKQLTAGEPLVLTAKVVAEPKAFIKWLKDGDEIKAGPGVVIEEQPDGTNTLKIQNTALADAGKYVIVATNDEGKTRSAAQIDIKGPPKKKPEFLEDLQPMSCNDGQPVMLKAKISGEPKPQVKWLKDGEEIKPSSHVQMKEEPDGTVALHIPKTTPKDSGKYSVAIANEEGETRCSAPLTVNQPPVFTKPLLPVTVIHGFPTKLETKVAGVPRPDIEWLKNGEPFLADGEHVKLYSPDGTASLIFEKSKPEHAARYTCNAKNEFGESHAAGDLHVIEKEVRNEPESAPEFLTHLCDVSVLEQESIKFEATVSGYPVPDIHWFLDEQPVLPSNNILPTFDGKKVSLEIKHCNPQHAGDYECHLVNRAGNAVSKAKAKVTAFSAPEFIQKLVDIQSPTKDPVKLVCRVTGVPEPTVEWYHNGNLLYPGIKYSMLKQGDQCHLNIPYPRVRDSGKYECHAKNIIGEDKCSARIEISDAAERGEQPIFLKKLVNVDALVGHGTKFTACVTGIPKPLVKWFKDGEQLEPSDHYRMEHEPNGILRLIIYQAKPTDKGEYRVSVSNKYGSDTCTAHLHLEGVDEFVPTCTGDEADKQQKTGPPNPLPDPPFIIRMTDTYLTLGWRPSIPSYPRVPVTYEVEMCPQPDGMWHSYKSGLKDSVCDVHGLIPGKDYRFRIRVENKHGVSDPSPYTTAHRSKIHPPLPGDYKPKDYEIEHPPLEKQLAAPRFLRQEEETIYGIRGQPVRIEFWVYGNPQPEISWHFNGLPVESGKYDYLQDRNGQVIIFITRMTENDVGTYVCHAVNELGEARQKTKLMIAEVPIFTKKLEETSILIRGRGKLECCVMGVPFPKIKWFKDWHPIYESSRVKITEIGDKCTLSLSDVILKDGGLYTCSASNVAGSTSTSAILSITEAESDFILDRDAGIGVKPRNKLFEDIYDIGDELGRGTQGIIHHTVERNTGSSLAAKMMHGTEKMRDFMEAELDIMNQLCHPRLVRLWDAFDTRTSLTLVTDLCGGGELLNNLIQRPAITESNVAHYIKQVLEGLEHMHSKQIGHLGLTIGDLLITRVNSDNLKICDFGLATRLHPGREFIQQYGHPEFVAPEIANKQPVTLAADIWSVGIITYLLLTGISPFLGENDRETLKNAQQGKVDFYHDNFAVLSDEAKDFVRKLLVFDPSGRLDVWTALKHPWLRYADVPDKCDELGNMPQLQEYAKKWRNWYSNAFCKRFYRRRPLDSCFTHPSHMIYPTDIEYTPPVTPDRVLGHSHVKPAAFDDVTFQQKIIREPIDFRSESQYQSGPDTFLLPLRDKDFPVRVRQYLRLGAKRSPTLADHLKEKHWADCDIVVKERRRFVDVMDEEIYDEKRGLVHSMPLRLQKEVGCLGMDSGRKKSIQYAEASPPFFREKIRDVVIRENDDAVFKCFAVSKPPPLYSWFRNDGILIESSRIVIKQQEDGHCELRLRPGKAYDVGVFKCVARNIHGVAVCRARLKIGDVPGHPEPPVVQQCSDTELYVAWNPPKSDGNSPILCYSLEYRKTDEKNWTKVAKNISHEFFVIKDLSPSSTYHLRLAAKNRFGWGEISPPSEPCNTLAAGSPKVKISKARKYQQEMTERGQELFLDDLESANINYELEDNPPEMVEGDPLELYNFVSEVARGRFSVVVKVWVKAKNTTLMAKVMQKTPKTESPVWREYDILRSLRHERIVSMEMASTNPTSTILIMEKLSGMDILTYFSCRHQYTEEMVAKVVQQVLDALEYLHFRGICYVELQPDNVVLTDQHHLDVKLIDFGSAQCVPEEEGKIEALGNIEYMAPETVKEHEVSSATDIWGVGVLMYILLSGVSPFHGENDAETRSNVLYVRYHFDNLYKEVTQEATRFLMQLFKRTPQKRPTAEECFENKWLLPSEFMMKKREHAVFLTHRIHEFSEQFHAQKRLATPPELLNMFGMSFSKSVSLETDALEEF